MNPQLLLAIIQLVDHVALALRLGPKAKREFDILSSLVRSMVVNDREPTEQEWRILKGKVETASARLRAAAALLDEG